MSLEVRQSIYKQIEEKRGRPLITYVTSTRPSAVGQIAADSVPEIAEQLARLPTNADALDLAIISNGGDPTVAWRIVTMIRERVKTFSVIVPQAAFSAATLVAMGADEIVMHPFGNLGPVDPQITTRRGQEQGAFGSEDLAAFLTFAKRNVGITDQEQIAQVFLKFCDQVGTVPIGVAARSAQLSLSMGEKLLRLHMSHDGDLQKVRTIAERLSKEYFHHGYALGRREAKDIGLKVAPTNAELETLVWKLWTTISADLKLQTPFSPIEQILGANPWVSNPPVGDGQPQQMPVTGVLIPARFDYIAAFVESTRMASRHVVRGVVMGMRAANGLEVNLVPSAAAWERETMDVASATGDALAAPALIEPKPAVKPQTKNGRRLRAKGARQAV